MEHLPSRLRIFLYRGDNLMNRDRLLTFTSVLLMVLFAFHLTEDIVHGWEPGNINNLIGFTIIAVVYLYGTVVIQNHIVRYIINVLGGILAFGASFLHMSSPHFGEIART